MARLQHWTKFSEIKLCSYLTPITIKFTISVTLMRWLWVKITFHIERIFQGVTILQITHPKLQSNRNIFFGFLQNTPFFFFFGIVHNRLLRVWWLWKLTEFKIGLGVILIYMSMISCYCYLSILGFLKCKISTEDKRTVNILKAKNCGFPEEFSH